MHTRIGRAAAIAAVAAVAGLVAPGLASAEKFNANPDTLGEIEDAEFENPRTVAIPVAGMSSIEGIEVETELYHTFAGDLTAFLQPPEGDVFHILFESINGASAAANFGGIYTFADRNSSSLWAAAASLGTDQVIPAGRYRTVNGSSQQTSLGDTFAGIDPNGSWFLVIIDLFAGDTGAINHVALDITPNAKPVLTVKKPKVNQKKRQAKLRFSATDNVTPKGQLKFTCKLDKKKFKPCKSPQTFKKLKPRKHKVVIRVTDAAGNKTQAAKRIKIKKPKKK